MRYSSKSLHSKLAGLVIRADEDPADGFEKLLLFASDIVLQTGVTGFTTPREQLERLKGVFHMKANDPRLVLD